MSESRNERDTDFAGKITQRGNTWDVIVIGAGMGGSALVWSLRHFDIDILVLERGPYVPQEAENWDPEAVIATRRYEPDERWIDQNGDSFRPRVYYNVGGSSKFFGGSAFRLRREDFRFRTGEDGEAPAWPISYEDLAPWYAIAEKQMMVHGERGADPTDPETVPTAADVDSVTAKNAPTDPYPFPPLEDEQDIAWLRKRFLRAGLRPFPLPIAVHQGGGGHCRKGSPCDGFPCKIRAKGDGENAFLRPALRKPEARITLITGAEVRRLDHDYEGERIVRVEYELDSAVNEARLREPKDNQRSGGFVVLAAGAANSACLLLRSCSDRFPVGLANSSGMVGRNFMAHNNTVLMAINPFRVNSTRFQKTLAINDWYDLGNIQMRGKVLPHNLAGSSRFLVRIFRHWIARHSFDFWVMSEDYPDPENRVEPLEETRYAGDGGLSPVIRLVRRQNNLKRHRDLVLRFKKALRACGFLLILEREPEARTIQHQVGTIRFGNDPRTSVLDRDCRSYDIENLYVVDGSVFPSSAAVNPALTIAANALRVGNVVGQRLDGINRGTADTRG